MQDLQIHLANEVEKRAILKLSELKSYEVKDESPLYLVEDIMLLLGIKAIWHKISNLVNDQEKFNRTIKIDGHARHRTLITKRGVCKIIASMRTKPHEKICEFFGYQSLNDIVSRLPTEIDPIKTRDDWMQANSFEPGPNNIYIKRLRNIFVSQKIETFYKVALSHECHVILDAFFPKYGIVVLFNKKDNIFGETNTPLYMSVQQELLKKFIHLKNIIWIQFVTYDTNNSTQFDALLKDLITFMTANKSM
jgi:hypothetical protein